MCKREAELQAEVDGWLQAAEAADAAEDKAFGADRRGDEMPDWGADKKARLAKIRQAKAELEAEAKAKAAAEQPARAKVDEKPPRKPPPAAAPEPKAHRNFTDPESRIATDQRLHRNRTTKARLQVRYREAAGQTRLASRQDDQPAQARRPSQPLPPAQAGGRGGIRTRQGGEG